MNGVRWLAAVTIGVAGLAGCVAPLSLDGPSVAELPAPVPDWVSVRVTEADDGRRVELARGASIAVALRAPALSGLEWREAATPAGLVRTGVTRGPVWPPDAPASTRAPPPVWQVFVFEAREAVGGELAFELASDGGRVRRVSIRVSVS